MEFVKRHFAIFMAVVLFLCSEIASNEIDRIWKQVQDLENDMYFVKKNIRNLLNQTSHLNMSVVEACGRCVSGNTGTTSYPPVINEDERQYMIKVNNDNVLIKYQSLIKAFITEKRKNRELRDQLLSIQNSISASDLNVRSRLELLEDTLSASEHVAERDRGVQSRLRSMEDIISDIRNNMTLMNKAIKMLGNDRDQELDSRLQSMKKSIEDTISDIHRDLRNNMTTFMTSISNRIDEYLLKAETTSVKPDINTKWRHAVRSHEFLLSVLRFGNGDVIV